jgi:hypothetical protein
VARNGITFADLVAIARRVGVTVVEAPSSHRGKLGKMGTVAGCTCHHTGTPNSYRPELEYPDFEVVREGRAGLVNSLSAYGLGRHTTIYVFSEFLSWHAGEWLWQGITDGNGHFLGIEAAGVGDWTPFQRAVYPRLVASILLFIGEGVDMAPRHLDGAMPRGRKSDAAAFTFYDEIQQFMDHPEFINVNYTPAPTSGAALVLGDDMPTVIQAGTKPPVLVVGGLFVELRTKAEQVNALLAYNSGIKNADGSPFVDADGIPGPVWVEAGTLDNLIAQSQQAVRGGS